MKINVAGNIFGDSGFTIHTYNLAKALNDIGLDVAIESPAPRNWQIGVDPSIKKMLERDYRLESNILITLPQAMEFKFPDRCKHIIPFVVFEGDKIHSSWARILNRDEITRIFVPSKHVKLAVEKAGVDKQIDIIPHGIDLKLFNPSVEPLDNFKSDEFTFMYVGGWSQGEKDRKGLDLLLRAFSEEFAEYEKVKLIVKINMTYCPPGWNLSNEIAKLNLPEDRKKITFITNQMPYDAMPKLYKCADCLVIPTKAEGFCFPILEAMAVGVPSITTYFGGQSDFVNNSNGIVISKGEMIDATDENYFYEETKWFKCDIEELRKQLRYAFTHPDEMKHKGKIGLKTASKYTWEASAKKVKSIMEGLK